MFKMTKILIPVIALSFQIGCSSDSPEEILEDILNKNSVALSKLDQHDITYEKTADGTTQTDRYCPAGVLKDTNDNVLGSWSVTGNDLTLNSGRTYKTSNATLEKNTTYDTETADTYKVIKIAETICL